MVSWFERMSRLWDQGVPHCDASRNPLFTWGLWGLFSCITGMSHSPKNPQEVAGGQVAAVKEVLRVMRALSKRVDLRDRRRSDRHLRSNFCERANERRGGKKHAARCLTCFFCRGLSVWFFGGIKVGTWGSVPFTFQLATWGGPCSARHP